MSVNPRFGWCSTGSKSCDSACGCDRPHEVLSMNSSHLPGLSVNRTLKGASLSRRSHYGIAVIRPLRTATGRSWQPDGFGDSSLPDGIFQGALELPIGGDDADAGSRSRDRCSDCLQEKPIANPTRGWHSDTCARWHGGEPRRPFPWQDPVRAGLLTL